MNNFEICSNGKLVPLEFNIEDLDLNLNIEDLNFDHLLVYDFNNDSRLVIDTFNDRVAMLINNSSSLSKENLFYFANKFLGPKSNKGLDRLKAKYKEAIKDTQSKIYSFIICPTYSCNMRCIYCYQQGNDDLNKKVICEENLFKIFNYIEKEEIKIKQQNKDYKIFIELFGGEPIQSCNRDVLQMIFDFARKNKYFVVSTTNGVEIDQFYDLFLTYNGYIGAIHTTIDGTKEYHNSRRIYKKDCNSFDRIIKNIEFLIELGIFVTLSINIDKNNIYQLKEIIDFCEIKNWFSNKYFQLQIGRVDDRLFETNYEGIISEGEILEYIYNLNLDSEGKNIKCSFLKTLSSISKKFNTSLNKYEYGRPTFHYCWATDPSTYVKYIDSDLNVFRCTYTVGREDLSLGKLDDINNDTAYFYEHNLFKLQKCLNCKIGGYCSGGCKLSSSIDLERQCNYEVDNFNYFINKVIVPNLREKLRDILEGSGV